MDLPPLDRDRVALPEDVTLASAGYQERPAQHVVGLRRFSVEAGSSKINDRNGEPGADFGDHLTLIFSHHDVAVGIGCLEFCSNVADIQLVH